MTFSVKSFVVVFAFLFIFTGYQSQQIVQGSESNKHVCAACECKACEKGLAGETVWCDSCKVGYADGHKVKCKHCFEGMSGNKDVWCDSCSVGFLKGKKVDCKECCHKGEICETCQHKN
ncbi:MAG: hypothetical protein HON76_09845 [Candidatus Scalindua sp.]|jgi:hypothetical protein|nr:hypothetical protein [Candidatus Scalindua sp.]MBT6226464.1 hypothetical protein [Candidatus Scalindua sp.]MBT6562815.1 hypothetical protein [Candidatus Scalindua sp.]